LVAAAFAAFALGGCGLVDGDAKRPAAADAAGPKAGGAGTRSGLGAVDKSGENGGAGEGTAGDGNAEKGGAEGGGKAKGTDGLPDPCGLLSRDDVVRLTGRRITEVDGDGAAAGDPSRYCQWQQDGGQLDLFLSTTTAAEFEAAVFQGRPVDGVEGYDAFSLAGHLYVRDDDVQVDVYSHAGTDDQNLAEEITVMRAVLPKLEH